MQCHEFVFITVIIGDDFLLSFDCHFSIFRFLVLPLGKLNKGLLPPEHTFCHLSSRALLKKGLRNQLKKLNDVFFSNSSNSEIMLCRLDSNVSEDHCTNFSIIFLFVFILNKIVYLYRAKY